MSDPSTEVRVLVCGDRAWSDRWILRAALDGLLYRYGPRLTIIEGEALGADTEAKEWAVLNGLSEYVGDFHVTSPDHYLRTGDLLRFPAHWSHNVGPWRCEPDCKEVTGRAAGAIRNVRMLKEGNPQVVLGFHNNIRESKGTLNMLAVAKKAEVPCYVIGSFIHQKEQEQLSL